VKSPASRTLAIMARVDILPSPDDAPAAGMGDAVIARDGVDDDMGLGVALGVSAFVGVALGGTVLVGEGIDVALGEGVGMGVAVKVAVGGSVTTGGVGRSVAVAERANPSSAVGVASPSPASAVGVAISVLGAARSPGGASSISKTVGPPMIQPATSSAQRAPGKVRTYAPFWLVSVCAFPS
jgi:hypothetical protein